ncbi:MAG: flagellar protein FlgN [Clostridiaceae bacterium]|jgi:hypothetical protein|nr:flagellar protein FlgN [Clostridiaceae bacterium]
MDASPEVCIQKVIEASNKKYSCLQQLIVLTRAQTEVISEESMDGLEKLIGEKQVRIDEINKVDEDFGMYVDLLKQKLGVSRLDEIENSSLKGLKELKQITGQIMELLNEINVLEKNNNKKAKDLLDDLGAQIRQIREGKKLNNLYNTGSGTIPPAYFVDKKK